MINRFLVMATLQAARAHELGLSMNEAKSFGLNRAIFYAAAKSGFKHAGHTPLSERSLDKNLSDREKETIKQSEDMVSVGNEKAYAVEMDGKHYFVIGGKVLEPKDFNRQIEGRFNGKFAKAWDEAVEIVKNYGKETLESQRKFYEQVYKIRRDELAKKWSHLATE